MRLLAAIVLGSLPPSVHPWPIGAGPRYRVPAAPAAVRAGRPVAGMRCGHAKARFRVHVELFADRQALLLPPRIGVGPDCVYPLRTSTPTGVVAVAGTATVGDLFRVWGQALGPKRLLSFRDPVRAYVAGRSRPGDPRTIPLAPREQVVLEVGGYVPPHPSFLFPKGSP